MKKIKLSEDARALKAIDNELWICQMDGIAVYDDELELLRTLRGRGDREVESVVLLSVDRVVVAGADLYILTKSGWWIYFQYYI